MLCSFFILLMNKPSLQFDDLRPNYIYLEFGKNNVYFVTSSYIVYLKI
jgi:hypothetical protein